MSNKTNIFIQSKIYDTYSKGTVNFLKKNINKIKYDIDNFTVLDFGCGPCTIYKYIKFKKVFLYDIYAIPLNKFNKKFKIIKKFNDIRKINTKFDLIILNGVIQYMDITEINKTLSILLPKVKKGGFIFFGDVPQYNRIIEYILLFFNIKNFISITKYFLKKKLF